MLSLISVLHPLLLNRFPGEAVLVSWNVAEHYMTLRNWAAVHKIYAIVDLLVFNVPHQSLLLLLNEIVTYLERACQRLVLECLQG